MPGKVSPACTLFSSLLLFALLGLGCAQTERFETYRRPGRFTPQKLSGSLFQPSGPGPFPAVVLLHGCDGINAAHLEWAGWLVRWGYAALVVDSFGPRGVNEACVSGTPGPTTRARDAFGALMHLQSLPFIAPERIAVMGWSQGGGTVLQAVHAGNEEYFPPEEERRFRGAIALYPGCLTIAGNFRPTTDLLVLVGDKDDWTPAPYCKALVLRRTESSASVELVVYPGASHAYDVRGWPRSFLGHRLAYDPSATADSKERVREFLRTHLGPGRP